MTRRAFSRLALFAGLVLAPCGPAFAQAAGEGVMADVLVRQIQRGDLLTERDFAPEEVSAGQARGAVSAEQAAGLEAARTLRSGSPVRARDLAEPRLVRRGQPVTIILRSGALSISATGRALADGALGDPVRVFSEATNQTLDGVVESSGRVRISAG
ncbi:flagellar basal body P-ring formation chaperone FlgA [Alteriqipengyuania lutimaris]|uniref:Flagella basal body P-ring formation protein FlgA n=1 Tax=Alteriqipengyuania lutimaris TaxID=1538146 RepID=A0A395LMX7_9SPHN|nr:flagellar basal body P-ring formation chaperone FlgA [Alteriqipengyuania lutimaris]MBB3032468.1 flagella basal body P-ring formation protein FlgA [Alteriqipengyuania lutimaris]RDS78393.1 flagella basal body P-ring formation protein FlgA [Alteriqipengyuania lutimaris]